MVREGTRRATTRSNSFECHAHNGRAAGTNAHHPHRFATTADPVGSGFVASLARPSGNATGFVVTEGSLGGKWLELLKEVAPRVARVAMLFNPVVAPYAESYLNPLRAAASSLAVEAIAAPVRDL